MVRLAYALLVLAACGTSSEDKRQLTVQYLTEAILAPTCGAAQCHSTFKQSRGDVFDTVEGARHSLVDNGLIQLDSVSDDRDPLETNPKKRGKTAQLYVWITATDPYGRGIGRMPYDAPMPNTDVEYIRRFIVAGALGAQCNPATTNGLACNGSVLTKCDVNWNFAEIVHSCTAVDIANGTAPKEDGCTGGACTCTADYGDCDVDVTNGCETRLDNNAHCGGCSVVCSGDKQCQVRSGGHACQCLPGFDACDMATPNKCMAVNTNANCGACGAACTGTQTCMALSGPGSEKCQ